MMKKSKVHSRSRTDAVRETSRKYPPSIRTFAEQCLDLVMKQVQPISVCVIRSDVRYRRGRRIGADMNHYFSIKKLIINRNV